MPFAATLCLALAAPFAQSESFQSVECVSPSGRFVARVRKADGQEHVDDLLARWMLTVEARNRDGRVESYWSSLIQHRAGERLHFLADDGLAFVEVDPSAGARRDLVRVWHASREPYALDAAELASAPGEGPWLAAANSASLAWVDSPLGPTPQLLLELADGGERRVDLASGAVFRSHEWTSELAAGPLIDEALRKHSASAYVRSATVPPRVYFGEPIEIAIEGAHPSPGWHFAGFDVRVASEDGLTSILLTPLSLAPAQDRPQAQVMCEFRCSATLAGLAPGRHELRVLGLGDEPLPPLELRVLPARAWVELELHSGRTVRVYTSGVVVAELPRGERRVRVLDGDERTRFEEAYRALSRRGTGAQSSAPVEAYCLRWTLDEKHVELRGDATTLDPAALALVELLAAEGAR